MDWPSNAPRLHPVVTLFPLMGKDELATLRKDILANGINQPLLYTPMGELVDGRNRWLAARDIGITLPKRTYTDNVYSYVVRKKLSQFSFTKSQRIMMGARLFDLPLPELWVKPTHADICEWFDISISPLQRGRRILKTGVPQLIELAEEGNTPITPIERVAKLTPTEQRVYVAKVRRGEDPITTAPPPLDYHYDRQPKPEPVNRPGRHYAPPRTRPTSTPVPTGPQPPMPKVTLRQVADTLAAVGQQLQRCGDTDPTIPQDDLVAWTKEMRWGLASLNKLRKRVQARLDILETEAQ